MYNSHISTYFLLHFKSIRPGNSAVAECGFSLMSFIVEDIRSSLNFCKLDATIIIHYHRSTLSDREPSKIIDIWKRCGNRRIKLYLINLYLNSRCLIYNHNCY